MQTDGPVFGKNRYISLTTFRKTGAPVATAVWLAERDGRIYVRTEAQAGKIKRLRHNPAVEMAPCTRGGRVTGPSTKGTARILAGGEAEQANKLLNARYGWQVWLVDLVVRAMRKQPAFIEIVPEP